MKKIALILALVMCLSVALVACDSTDTESTPADTSSAAPAESETPVEDKSEAAPVEDESEEAPVEESSEAPAEESEEEQLPPAEASDTNAALGKTYTHSGQYHMGGADVGWGWDENAPISYPDEEDKSLTDGVIAASDADAGYQDAVWAGFTTAQPDFADCTYITIDLGASTNVAKVVLHAYTVVADGISGPKAMEVYVSETEDFSSATKLGDVTSNFAADAVTGTLEVGGNATGRYVQLRISHNANWIMVSEVEVFPAK